MSSGSDTLKIEARSVPQGKLVKVAGDVDLRTSPRLRSELQKHAEQNPRNLIVDLTDVPYMDSSGVGTLVELRRHVSNNGGTLILLGLQSRVRSVFEITQLDSFFTIVDNLDQVEQ